MVNRAAIVLFPLVLLCITVNAFALGNKDKDGSKPVKVEVSGMVRMVGNSPMNFLVISGENREWHIVSNEQEKLMPFQQQTVTVKAREYYYDRTFANGISAGRDYYLRNIVIIEPKRSPR
jgi:hypothetical protein